MRYYIIQESSNREIIGQYYPQAKVVKYNCHVWDEPKFVGHVNYEKVDFEPITANAILHAKSNVTDLISAWAIGFTNKLLISNKLKKNIKQL